MSNKDKSPTVGPYTLQQITDNHHGYPDWSVYAIRSPQNVCLAVVGEVDRFESEKVEANARVFQHSYEMLQEFRNLLCVIPYLQNHQYLPSDVVEGLATQYDKIDRLVKKVLGDNHD